MPRPQTPPAHGGFGLEWLSIFVTEKHKRRDVFQGWEGSLLEGSYGLLAVMIQRLNQLSWPSISAILVKSASHKHNDTMGFVQHETTLDEVNNLSIAKRIMLVKSKTVQTNSAWVDLTSLSFTSKSIQLNIRPYLNRRAVKPQGKSAPLLIIVTYSYCRQHPTAPETITWPTTAHHMQSSRGLPVAPVRAAAETMRGRWRV